MVTGIGESVVRWGFGWCLGVTCKEKWEWLVVCVVLYEEKWKLGWCRTWTKFMSNFFEVMVEGLVTVVVMVIWELGWSRKVK